MKKKLLVSVGVIALIAVGFIFYAASNLDSLIERYRGDIEQIASSSLGTSVKLGKIEGSIFPTTRLIVDRTNIGDTKSGEITLENLTLKVNLLPILSKRLEIVELSLAKPSLTLRKNASGLHIPGLTKSSASPDLTSSKSVPSETNNGASAGAPQIGISLDKLAVSDAQITIEDEVKKKSLSINHLNLASKISLESSEALVKEVNINGTLPADTEFNLSTSNASFNFESGEVNSDPVVVSIAGSKITLNPSYATRNSTGSVEADIADFSLTKLIPLIKEIGPDLSTMPFKIEALSTKISALQRITEQEVATKDLKFSLNGSPISGQMKAIKEDNSVNISELSFSLFGGSLTAPTNLALGDIISFDSAMNLAGIEVDKAMGAIAPALPVKLFGHIDQVKGELRGELSANFMKALAGSLSVSLTKGGIRGTNLPGAVLKAANKIPLLGDALYAYTPKQYRSVLDSPDTEFSKLIGTISLADGRMRSKDLQLIGALYSINISGTFGIDSSVDADATITFSKDFSESLAASKKEIANLLSADGTLVIPLTIQGTLPKVAIVPNFERLIELAGKRLLKDQAAKMIDKALGGKSDVLRGIGSALGF